MNAKKLLLIVSLASVALSLWALPTAVKNRAFFEGITYKWPYNAAPADQTESNLAQVATDPDQIIAMLREVYSNKAIPGNYVRGYDASNTPEGTWLNGTASGTYPVAYPAIGTLGETRGTYGYHDAYGWGLDGAFYSTSKTAHTVTFDASVEADCSSTGSVTKNGFTVSTSTMTYRSSTQKYYVANEKANLHIESLSGYEITKVEITCSSSYYVSYFSASTPSGTFSKSGAVRTWVGSAAGDLILQNPNYRVQISKVVVTYQVPGAKTKYGVGSTKAISGYTTGSMTLTPGSDKGTGTLGSMTITKNHITVGMANLSATPYRTFYNVARDITFTAESGYVITSIVINFENNHFGGIDYSYGTSSSSLSTASPYINSTTLTWQVPATNVVFHTVNAECRITGVTVRYKYIGSFDGYLAPDTYVPNEEGNTVLLLELKDGVTTKSLINGNLAVGTITEEEVDGKVVEVVSFDEYAINDYASLRAVVAATIKSARVLTSAKRVGSGADAGTLFKIDCDKLNRFYLIGKGQLRWFNNDYKSNNVNANNPPRYWSSYDDYQPYYNTYNYYDQSVEALFGHMFEQFSPSQSSDGTALNDVYRLLVNGESFDVKHDCIDVVSANSEGHEFNMYGKASLSDDCQDVRDMMFLVPDYRMLNFTADVAKDSRDPYKAQRYINYNPVHAPTLGLYVIKLDPIETVEKVEGQDAYDVTLNWNSNLLKFLPGETGKYTLYRVTNVNGVETYTALTEVTTANTGELTYVDRVPQTSGSQTVTYAVRGQDQDGFLTLQMSNKESAVIPGTDVSEQLQLQLGADYYSRFDPQLVQNNYSNLVKLGNSQVTNIQADYLTTDGTEQFTFTRSYVNADGDTVPTTFATAHVASMADNTGTLAVTLQSQDFFTYGYNSNGNSADETAPNGTTFTLPFTYDATGVNFGDVQIYDNFSVSVAANDHPGEYIYRVLFQYNDGEDKYAYSNNMSVYVEKTDMTMSSYTLQQVDGDTDRGLPVGSVDFDINVKYSSKKDILRYDAYRWPASETNRYIIDPTSDPSNEQDVPPAGIAGNQGDHYSVAINTGDFLYTGQTAGLDGDTPTGLAHFRDFYAGANAGTYDYVPVVERFAPLETRSDYNTYGAPLRPVASGDIWVSMSGTGPVKSTYTWTDADNGKTYAYYDVQLSMLARGISGETLIPEGYELYKVRTWRLIDPQYLGEQQAGRQGRINGDLLVEELTYPAITADQAASSPLGASACPFAGASANEHAGTFGALDVVANDITIPVRFIVRAYYTRTANLAGAGSGAPRRAAPAVADGAEFYVVEQVIDTVLDDTDENPIVTAVSGVEVGRVVADVTYYDLMGRSSARPLPGINSRAPRPAAGPFRSPKVVN